MSAFNRLLNVLGLDSAAVKESAWGESPPADLSERRSSPRYPTSPNEADMGWWAGGERFYKVAAQFRNLSSGGALIVTREMPPHEYVWIGFTKSGETRWCPVRVVRARETSVGLFEVGLAFRATCDSDRFTALIQRGVSVEDTTLPSR
jgi:PilZ domain